MQKIKLSVLILICMFGIVSCTSKEQENVAEMIAEYRERLAQLEKQEA